MKENYLSAAMVGANTIAEFTYQPVSAPQDYFLFPCGGQGTDWWALR